VAVPLAVACAAILVVAASSVRDMRLSLGLTDSMTGSTEAGRAADAAAASFPAGIIGPTEMLVEGPSVAMQASSLARLESALRRTPGVAAVAGGNVKRQPLLRDVLERLAQHRAQRRSTAKNLAGANAARTGRPRTGGCSCSFRS
jgi:uncharacterized membrane protein YdfJ with MMPL/SSD domain